MTVESSWSPDGGLRGYGPRITGVLCLVLMVAACSSPVLADIRTSKHNLSLSGPGTLKSTTEDRVCRFCHVPHNASPAVPLWAHGFSGQTYSIYASSTIQGSAGQPNGSTKLCLGCHDGAYAVGGVVASRTVYTVPIAMSGGVNYITGSALIGTNLTDDHPVSLAVATGAGADPEILLDTGDAKVKYDAAGRVQCTSCHDPHDDTNPKFLLRPNLVGGVGSQLCVICHAKWNWTGSSHRNSTKLAAGKVIKAEACAACHQTHAAPIPARLLKDSEEALCNSCHNGSTSPAVKNVATEFNRSHRHPIEAAGKHNPAESFDDLNDPVGANRHSECEDCHSPHGASSGTHVRGSSNVGAVLLGAWGMKPIYGPTPLSEPISWEKVVFRNTADADALEAYLCFKCHRSLAKYFNPSNPSYHAVVGNSKADATYNGSYVNGWNATNRMTCTDCHTSSNASVKGPHGSDYALNTHNNYSAVATDSVLLFADYMRAGGDDFTNRGTGGNYDTNGLSRNSDNDLCFHCHNRRVYGHASDNTYLYGIAVTGLRGVSDPGKNMHLSHVRGIACTTCHVAHGSNKPHLLAWGGDGFSLNSDLWPAGSPVTVPDPGGWSFNFCHWVASAGC